MPDLSLNYNKRLRELKTPYGAVLFCPGLPGSGSILYDKSLYANNGTLVGATWERSPGGLWGLSLDGDDYVELPVAISNAFTGQPSVTILQWVRFSNFTASTYSFYASAAVDSNIKITNGATITTGTFRTLTRSDAAGALQTATFSALSPDVLYFLASTVNLPGSYIEQYINETYQKTTGLTFANTTFQDSTNIVRLGKSVTVYQTGAIYLTLIIVPGIEKAQVQDWYQQTRKFFRV